MSRSYSTSSDLGLSRQSSKSYKAVCQKSNAELNETLRRLDIEHHSNISKILNERYNLRSIQHDLQRCGESDSSSESDSDEPDPNFISHFVSSGQEHHQSGQGKGRSAIAENSRQQSVCQLPCIIEEAWPVLCKPKSSKLSRSPLPPLSMHGFPTRSRKVSESSLGNPTTVRSRQRSSTLPIGHMPGDGQRKSEFKRNSKLDKFSESDGKRSCSDGTQQNRSNDEDVPKKPAVAWKEIEKCRYLRRRTHSSPDLYKAKRP